jgi:hypothetical protein
LEVEEAGRALEVGQCVRPQRREPFDDTAGEVSAHHPMIRQREGTGIVLSGAVTDGRAAVGNNVRYRTYGAKVADMLETTAESARTLCIVGSYLY